MSERARLPRGSAEWMPTDRFAFLLRAAVGSSCTRGALAASMIASRADPLPEAGRMGQEAGSRHAGAPDRLLGESSSPRSQPSNFAIPWAGIGWLK